MDLLDRFLGFLELLPNGWIYFFLGLSAFVENLFPPVPGDTVTVFGAFLVGTERLSFLPVYLTTTVGSAAGFIGLFWAGGLLGRRFFIERDFWFFKARDIVRGEAWVHKYGYFLILLNRFLPGVRSVISIVGGISKLKWDRVALLALISACLWNLVWIFVGYTLGNNWALVREKISGAMDRYNRVALMLMAAVAVFLAVRTVWVRVRSRKQKGS